MLESTEKLDVRFDLECPGLIIVVAATGAWEDQPGQLLPRPREGERVPQKIELIPPGDGTAVAEWTAETPESHLVYDVPRASFTRGRWTARLTNLGTKTEDFGIFVSYPSTRELHSADLSSDVFAELAGVHLELHRGHLASSLEVKTSAGPVTHYFTVDDIEYSCPWTPRVVAYFENLQSTSVSVSVPKGTPDPLFRYELGFDDEGTEINGTIPLDLRNIRLTVDLPIIVRYHKLARSRTLSSIDYEEADIKVSFSFNPRFEELIEWLPGFFPMWRRSIQRTVEDACRELLATPELRRMFSDAMHARVLEQIGENAKPVGVAAANGKLRFSYYTV